MTNGNHIPEDDLVLFALQLLPEERMRPAKQHVDVCDLCRTEIAKLQGDLVAYSMTSDFQAPPPVARERLMRQVAREPKPQLPPEPAVTIQDRGSAQDRDSIQGRGSVQDRDSIQGRGSVQDRDSIQGRDSAEPIFHTRGSRSLRAEAREEEEEEHEDRRKPRRVPWPVLTWTGWAVALGCSFFAGLQVHQRQQMQNTMDGLQAHIDSTANQSTRAQDALAVLTSANAVQIPLHSTATPKPSPAVKPGATTPPSPEALASYLSDSGALVFAARHMQSAPNGKTYELWLMPDNGRNPIPAGTFKPDPQGSASVVMPALPKGVPAKGFCVTMENEGGADTPTLPTVLAGS